MFNLLNERNHSKTSVKNVFEYLIQMEYLLLRSKYSIFIERKKYSIFIFYFKNKVKLIYIK